VERRNQTPVSQQAPAAGDAASGLVAWAAHPGWQPGSVILAVRSAWALVGVIGLTVVLMAAFYDDVVGSWADRHEGAREAFAQGGRLGLERAGFAVPAFLPVAATMLVVAAMLVWVLTAFFREGHRWGQLGLFALVLAAVFASIALGFVVSPPPVFVVVAVVSLLVEGVTIVCLWHRDTLAYLAGPWLDGPDGDHDVPGAGDDLVGDASDDPSAGPA
jgi:hypothetical protein